MASPLPCPALAAWAGLRSIGSGGEEAAVGSGEPSAAAMKLSGSSRGRRVRRLATENLLIERLDLRNRLGVAVGKLADGAALACGLAERDPVADHGLGGMQMLVVRECGARILGLL